MSETEKRNPVVHFPTVGCADIWMDGQKLTNSNELMRHAVIGLAAIRLDICTKLSYSDYREAIKNIPPISETPAELLYARDAVLSHCIWMERCRKSWVLSIDRFLGQLKYNAFQIFKKSGVDA